MEYKTFIVYIAALSVDSSDEIYLFKRAQKANLKANKTPIEVVSKYADFIDIFLLKLAIKPFKYTRINNHAIELVDN